jgi:phenylalanyl-tRNA synthetase alpha chain
MSSVIPSLLRNYKKDGNKLYLCPGIVYRRDVKDKTHVGEPHQMDIWYLTEENKNREDLLELVNIIIGVIEKVTSKKIEWRYNETSHNYTDDGIEVEIKYKGNWLEILECGLISQKLLEKHGLSEYSGLALGLGLERLVMIMKDIDDIRILLDKRISIQSQLTNLKKYKQVSNQPATKRDLSIAIEESINEEELTELILKNTNQETQNLIETIKIISETSYSNLPEIAIKRLGIKTGQKNVLLRIVLRDLAKTLESEKANNIYNEIYQKIHKGTAGYWI